MSALVAQVGRSEEGVKEGVDQHIAVAVAGKAVVVGYLNPSQHQAAAWHERVGVKADADPEFREGHWCARIITPFVLREKDLSPGEGTTLRLPGPRRW